MLYERRTKFAGTTLIELLIGLLIMGILLKFATVSYSRLIFDARITVATSELHAALLYARSEALKRGGNIIVCRSISASTTHPMCDSGGTDPSSNSSWGDGWIIFHDGDGDGKLSETDTILRVQEKLFSSSKDGSIVPTPNRKQIKFNSFGQVYGNYIQFAIANSPELKDPDLGRFICIASGGRARVDKIACSPK
ncbi:GspH/FimT family pseudopilin [Undibacterium sp. Ji22W]|uniref:GspH/FimT family pseudopilin n=1 Tax=Undibacterium sp. Ji22W TaxID=3413038 RepID=UPI003BEFAD8F